MAVEAKPGFQSQRIPCAETARSHLIGSYQRLSELDDGCGWNRDLKSIFAGIPGAGDPARHPGRAVSHRTIAGEKRFLHNTIELLREPKHPDDLVRSNLQTLALVGDDDAAFAYAVRQLTLRLKPVSP